MKRIVIAGGLIGLALTVSGCGTTQSCVDYVRETRSGDNRFVEQTFSDGNFYKGFIGQISGGQESVYAHWECSLTDDGPEITWFQLAAN